MKVKKLSYSDSAYPAVLADIPTPPKELYVLGDTFEELLDRPRVAIVGSRGVSTYGRQITAQLASELARQGVVIISGLALGVDAIAHRATIEAGGNTLAVLPCGLDRVYPASHHDLAKQLLARGGALLSEYPAGMPGFKQNFIARNRIVAGLADILLITEAAEKSGSLHTARFALEQGKEVMAVPGNINSPTSAGTNNLIKAGATPVTSVQDILFALGAEQLSAAPSKHVGASPEEQLLLDLLHTGTNDSHELLVKSQLSIEQFNQTLTMLEITGGIKALGNNQWAPK